MMVGYTGISGRVHSFFRSIDSLVYDNSGKATALARGVIVFGLAVQGWLWFDFFRARPIGVSPLSVFFEIVLIVLGVMFLLYTGVHKAAHLRYLLLALFNATGVLVAGFSLLYWSHATQADANFTQPLSHHLDAVYFTLGTLSTLGTDIYAKSQWARAVQTVQMGLDVVFLTFGVAFFLHRLTTNTPRREEATNTPENQPAAAAAAAGRPPGGQNAGADQEADTLRNALAKSPSLGEPQAPQRQGQVSVAPDSRTPSTARKVP
jgi:hypothetical protein